LSLTLVKTLATVVGRLLADGAVPVAMIGYTAGFHNRLRSASNTSVTFKITKCDSAQNIIMDSRG